MNRHSYVIRVVPCRVIRGYWEVVVVGINGKEALHSKPYARRCDAVRQAKSFAYKVQGRVRLDI